MKLKLIPLEEPAINFKIKSIHGKKKTGKISLSSKVKFIKQKIATEKLTGDDQIIHLTAEKLFDLLKSPARYGSLETGRLIDYLYRTILSLQRRKNKMLNEKKKKKN